MAQQLLDRFSSLPKLHDPAYKASYHQTLGMGRVAIWNNNGDLDGADYTPRELFGNKVFTGGTPTEFLAYAEEQFQLKAPLFFRGECIVDWDANPYFELMTIDPMNALPWVGLGTQTNPTADVPARLILQGGGNHQLIPTSGIFGVALETRGCNLTLNGYSLHTPLMIPEYTFGMGGDQLTLQHTNLVVGRLHDMGGGTLTVSERSRLDAQNISMMNMPENLLINGGKVETLWLEAGVKMTGNNSVLRFHKWSGGELLIEAANCLVQGQSCQNNPIRVPFPQNKLEVNNANITLETGGDNCIIIGCDNQIMVNAGVSNTRIIGNNIITDNGTGTVIL